MDCEWENIHYCKCVFRQSIQQNHSHHQKKLYCSKFQSFLFGNRSQHFNKFFQIFPHFRCQHTSSLKYTSPFIFLLRYHSVFLLKVFYIFIAKFNFTWNSDRMCKLWQVGDEVLILFKARPLKLFRETPSQNSSGVETIWLARINLSQVKLSNRWRKADWAISFSSI